MITAIITASLSPTHPSIHIIRETIESLGTIPMILAHDHTDTLNDGRYAKYFENLIEYVKDKPIQIVWRTSRGHLTGNIRNALQHVTTKYVLIVQHDLPFRTAINFSSIVEDMEAASLKYVRFNRFPNLPIQWDGEHYDIWGHVIKLQNSYIRTMSWSDNNHIASLDYYNDLVMKECKDGNYMDQQIFPRIKELCKGKSHEERLKVHEKYGTWVYGAINDPPAIKHTDGRGER